MKKNGNDPLSQAEINTLLAGVDMGKNRSIVVTVYGHDNTINQISVSSFKGNSGYYNNDSNAETYCETINALELKGDSWVFAKIISENKPYPLKSFLPVKFLDMVLKLDDRALQKVLREVPSMDIAKAFTSTNAKVKEKVFKNMSKRASATLKEDMNFTKNMGEKYIKECQSKVLEVIHHLIDTGEVVSPIEG